nr:MAG TPA: hypothetical protein [Caudoviricetes sp.]
MNFTVEYPISSEKSRPFTNYFCNLVNRHCFFVFSLV